MNSILNQTLTIIYRKAISFAQENKQTVGEKNDFYITLEQLEKLLTEWE